MYRFLAPFPAFIPHIVEKRLQIKKYTVCVESINLGMSGVAKVNIDGLYSNTLTTMNWKARNPVRHCEFLYSTYIVSFSS